MDRRRFVRWLPAAAALMARVGQKVGEHAPKFLQDPETKQWFVRIGTAASYRPLGGTR
jgi:hypothetical protein